MKPHTTRLPKHQEDQKGIRGEWGSGSVTRLGTSAITRGERGWVLPMKFHGVQISITRGVEEIVSDPNLKPSFFFLLFHVLCIIKYWEQRPREVLAMAKKKPHSHFLSTPVLGKKPSTQVPMV